MKRISIHVCTKDRPHELSLLLQSLRQQTFKNWDLVILDECQQPITSSFVTHCLLNAIMQEGHCVNIIKNDLLLGVCKARNKLLDEDYFNNAAVCRLDDDVILEPDYLERLLYVLNDYDIASGVTPNFQIPPIKRKLSSIGSKVINRKEFNKQGEITLYGDDCGTMFTESKIMPTHEFRSCALMKKKVADIMRYETNLSFVGFREEAFFSLRAQWEHKFKIGVDTGAVVWHFCSPQGGCRFPDYADKVKSDNDYFYKWAKKMYKKHGDL